MPYYVLGIVLKPQEIEKEMPYRVPGAVFKPLAIRKNCLVAMMAV